MAINVVINGKPFKVNLSNFSPTVTLNTFIRQHAQLTATKFMCLEGGCGACICVVKYKHPVSGEVRTMSVNSCLTLLNICADWEIITCEGLGNKLTGYHPLQKRLANMFGSQCGFCSPGFVATMYSCLASSKTSELRMEDVENMFGGNICRCTGYRPILDAMKSFACNSNINLLPGCEDIEDLRARNCSKTDQPCVGTCRKSLTALTYEDGTQWHWPETLSQLLVALNEVKDEKFMLVAGNTAHGVYRRSRDIRHYINVNAIPTLKQYSIENSKLTLGGNLSLSEVMDIFQNVSQNPGFEYCQQMRKHFDLIANVAVRNMGTLAGNILIKKTHPEFPSDVYITFEALNVQVAVSEDENTQKTMPLEDFLKATNPKLVIIAFVLSAYPKDKFVFESYKIMPRAQNAHAYVNGAFLLEMNPATGEVNAARICFGGIHPKFVHATSVEMLLDGVIIFEKETVSKIFTAFCNQIKPDEHLPDPSPEFRKQLACSLFYKFLLSIAPASKVRKEFVCGGKLLNRPLSSGMQTFQTVEKNYPVTQPVNKIEALIQCSGEAKYVNDMHTTADTVYCAFVGATWVGATIEQIDASFALKVPGVVAFFSAEDIPGNNSFTDAHFGYVAEEVFCSDRVKYFDQPLGVIVALTSDIANEAAEKVKVIYSNGAVNVMPTMADVLTAKEFSRLSVSAESPIKSLQLSDASEVTGSGFLDVGPQYHFTMEPHTTIIVPVEEGLQVSCATQWMDHTQCVIAKMLNMPLNLVQLKVRRLGGGYGAKISRCNHVACAAALAAYKLNRPVRFVQTIESMMNCIGKRWSCHSEYEFHAKSNGKIVGLKNTFFQDAGCTLNENPLDIHSFTTSKNCYEFTDNNYKQDGQAVITDAPSSTWCRAPGSVEGFAMIENIIEHIAFETKIDPADARLVNIKPGNKMAELLPRFIESTEYRKRREEINDYNEKNRYCKRGIGMTIIEYPMMFLGSFPVTLSIYHCDGTVIITHGGIEMGQGINTKACQVAAFVLGIPLEMVKVESSDSINGANSTVTGASVSSESVCYAVRKACNTLNERLKPVKDSLPKDASWEDVVQTAYLRAINLIASDYFKVDEMKPYSVFGLCVTEVEIDILTGTCLVSRVDILEDIGDSLSPRIDIGQIEGAFVMLLGYWLSEQLVYDRQTGELLTNRTWTYKPPGAKDIPVDFRIELLHSLPNANGFMRSKAVAEPPSCLAVSVIFAIQHAIQSARDDAGLKREWVRFGAPTTPETIVLSAGTDVKAFSLE